MKKNITAIIAIVLLLIIGFFTYQYFNKTEIIGEVVDGEVFNKDEIIGEVKEEDKKIVGENDYTNIKSRVRLLCRIGNVEDMLLSNSFKIIHNDIKQVRLKETNKDYFNYNVLPGIVYDSCLNSDPTFLERVVRYLQTDNISTLENDRFEIEKYTEFVQSIEFNSENVDKNKIQNNNSYFNEIVLENNLETIKGAYFSEYMARKTDAKTFFYTTSFLSIGETNKVLEETLSKFDDFSKDIGLDGIKEMKSYVLKTNGYNSLDELKNSLLNDFDNLSKNLKEKYSYNLEYKLANIDSLYNFYISEDYKNLKNDKENYELFQKIGRDYLIFAIASDDYADGLDEDWSGKESFGDAIKGNSIIKIGYVYLFES